MKNLMMSLFVLLAATPGLANEIPAHESTIGLTGAFVPGGFDSQSEVFTVVSGIFPNSCYAWKGARIEKLAANVIEITAVANVTQGLCMMVLIPFQKEVAIGQLPVGEHTLRFSSGDGTFFTQTVKIEE